MIFLQHKNRNATTGKFEFVDDRLLQFYTFRTTDEANRNDPKLLTAEFSSTENLQVGSFCRKDNAIFRITAVRSGQIGIHIYKLIEETQKEL